MERGWEVDKSRLREPCLRLMVPLLHSEMKDRALVKEILQSYSPPGCNVLLCRWKVHGSESARKRHEIYEQKPRISWKATINTGAFSNSGECSVQCLAVKL
ncbi:hypothetical protein BaRGS_00006244 [Batillaria attramentaria]|uniref:Uncharacterized protein n=1 Tax=Batillaria attramentaria TaxID=370345 RepID=A0ABD0LT91_9CAEN